MAEARCRCLCHRDGLKTSHVVPCCWTVEPAADTRIDHTDSEGESDG